MIKQSAFDALQPRLSSLDDLADLYQQEHVGMVRLAFLLTGSQSISEEVVHDAFIIVFERRQQVQQPGAYLRQTVVNLCRTKVRRRNTEQRKLAIVASTSDAAIQLEPELDETWQRLGTLSAKQRTALVLRFYEDLTVDGIAEAMGERPGTIKSLIHRGLKKLREEEQS